MQFQMRWSSWGLVLVCSLAISAGAAEPLAGTQLLTGQGDLSAQMVAGIDTFLMRELEHSVAERQSFWHRDFSSHQAYEKSVEPNREHLRQCIGAVDQRLPVSALEYVNTTTASAKVTEGTNYTIWAVRWQVFDGVFGEGLLLQPKGAVVARVVALPDADQTPEQVAGLAPGIAPELQFARRLAENGCQVVVPVLADRQDTWSGNAALKRFTNQPHREWIYRQAFEVGRHIIGYEVQKVLGAVDWFIAQESGAKIGVVGYGEGGLIALYSAAIDPRIGAAVVSGYFDSRQKVWEEPIYRNVFGLLREFDDAEIASLIAPRRLWVEYSESPTITGPPAPRPGRSGAAPGKWATADFNSVAAETERANALVEKLRGVTGSPAPRSDRNGGEPPPPLYVDVIHGNEGVAVGPVSERALVLLLQALGFKGERLQAPGAIPQDLRRDFQPEARQERAVEQMVEHTQRLLRSSERVRDELFWSQAKGKSLEQWQSNTTVLKAQLWESVLGKFTNAPLPLNPHSRPAYDEPKWTGYDVVLDVFPDVFAWGVLLLPKDLKAGERRPVVVCQHGLEGVPGDVIMRDAKSNAYGYYKAFAPQLAERGFVVFAPHNPYRGKDAFRVLQRKANPLGKSLFSVILAQHERILNWLSQQPFVDPSRIGFYGLSYGGKTAMRVPPLLDRYALSICSADFNEWAKKNATVESGYSYLFTPEYEMPEFNLANTFNYAEMASLIAPRPFMVERGHQDGVAPDEWVAYEFAKVRRFYAQMGIADRAEIEFFNGPHTINGVGTFKFLHKHLNWPER